MNFRLLSVFGLTLCAFLWSVPGSVRGEQLFASVNGTPIQNGGGSIVEYAPDGTATTFASGLDRPRGLLFDAAGNLFVATNTRDNFGDIQGTILKFSADGAMSVFASGFGANEFLEGLAMDAAGNIFVMASGNDACFSSTIFKLTTSGAISTFASVPDQGFGLIFDSAGNLLAPIGSSQGCQPSASVYRYTPNGTQSVLVGASAFDSSQAQTPTVLAFDKSGNLFVSVPAPPYNYPNPTGHIFKFTFAPDGTASAPIEFAAGIANPRGLAFDSAGNLFVADIPGNSTGNILKFSSGGTRLPDFASGIGRPQGNGGPEFLAFTARSSTPIGSNVIADVGTVGSADVTLTFPQVTVAGTTTVTPIDPSIAGTLPFGYELAGGSLAFQISTTATYTTPPPIIIGFQVPSVDTATFAQLRVLHNEGGTLVDRTATAPAPNPTTQTIYASVSSLSPFVIAKLATPTGMNQCKNGGWRTHVRADGSGFKNQGGCIKYVDTGK